MAKKRKKQGGFTMFAGLLLIAAALLLTLYNLNEQQHGYEAAIIVATELDESIPETNTNPPAAATRQEAALLAAVEPPFILHPDLPMPEVEIDGNMYVGIVEIPALNLALPVMSESTDEKLKISPCRFWGSVYTHDMVISAHNYDRHFGHLKDLPLGSEVRFTDMDGNVFLYTTCANDTLRRAAVPEMCAPNEGWDLSLFTCTVGGKTRFTLRCKLESYQWNRPQ